MLVVELRISEEVDQYVTKKKNRSVFCLSVHLSFQFGDSLRTFVKTGDKSKTAGG